MLFALAAGSAATSALAVVDTAETQRDSAYMTGSILMKNETTPLLMTSETRLRVNTMSAGGTWNLTFPATNFLGGLAFYLGPEGVSEDISMTVNGCGNLFAQYPTYEGEILRNGGIDPFVVNAFSYSPLVSLSGVPSTESSVESFAFSNTVMMVTARPDFSFDWSYDGGFVSFAGRNGQVVNGGSLTFPQQSRDATFSFLLKDAETHLPGIFVQDKYSDISLTVNGGRCVNNGTFRLNVDSAPTHYGTTSLSVTNGAQFVQSDSMSIGQTTYGNLRTAIISVDGETSSFRHSSGNLHWVGSGLLCVTNGASYVASASTYTLGSSASDRIDVTVSGNGSILDMSGIAGMLQFSGNDAHFAVSDGAKVAFPFNVTFGYNSASETTFEISGDGTEVRKAGAGSQIYFPTFGRSTVRMSGGMFGPKDGNAFMIRLGHEPGTVGNFHLSGGTLDLSPSGSSIDIGMSGEATFEVSGGSVAVGGAINLGLAAKNTTLARSILRMTGGAVECDGEVALCSRTDALRQADVVLDGGVLACDRLIGVHSAAAGGQGWATLSADGGTLKAKRSRADIGTPFIGNLDAVAFGAEGLTLDTDGHDVVAVMSPSNMTGVAGLLRKTGEGCLDMRFDSYEVARTTVAGGTLRIGNEGMSAMDTALCLTNGACLSLAGSSTGLTLAGLDVADGLLEVDTDDTITVTDGARLERLTLSLSSAPDTATTNTLFIFRTPLDAASQAALRRAYCVTKPASGYHTRFAYDAETGFVTTFAAKDSEPLDAADTTVWIGNDDVGWTLDANWSADVPTDMVRASFVENEATKTVSVGAGAQVAALAFGGSGFHLAGENALEVAGAPGAAEIAVSIGTTNEISAPLIFDSEVAISVADNAALAIGGAISGGGFRKSGSGTLTIAAGNSFFHSAAIESGITEVTHGDGLSGLREISIGSGTLAFDAAGMTVDADIVMAASTNGEAAVVSADKDVTLTSFTVGSGGFVKRGPGTLTLDARAAVTPWCIAKTLGSGANGRPANNSPTGFAADGSAPDNGVAGMTIAEGEVVLRGGGRDVRHMAPGVMVIGLNATNVSSDAQATLTLDNASLYNYADKSVHLFVGYGAGRSPARQTTPTLRLLNGSELICDTLRIGVDTSAALPNTHATLAMTGSTVRAGSIYFSDSVAPNASAIVRCRDSELTASSYPIYVHGAVDAVFDNCWIGRGGKNGRLTDRPVEFGLYAWNHQFPTGQVAFVNGTTLHATFINLAGIQKGMTFLFDDAEWDYGIKTNGVARDYTFSSGQASAALTMRMQGKGLALRPAAGTTFRTEVPFVGDGGVRNLGDGTVAFGAGAYAFDGLCYAAEGAAFDLSEAGTIAAARFGGAGTFTGVTAQRAILSVGAAEDWSIEEIPTFDGGELGTVIVDFGRTGETALSRHLPKNLPVARLTGGAKASFRLLGSSTGLSPVAGTFTVNDNGDVLLSVHRGGMTVVIR